MAITKLSTTTWIAVGASGTVVTAPNINTWTVGSSGTAVDLRAITVANLGGGTYKALAVGRNGIGISSPNGTAWSSAISNTATNPSGATVSLSDLNSVIYQTFTPPGGSSTSYYIITGDHGVVAISTNGTTWTTRTTQTLADFQGIVYTGTYFFAVGDIGLTYVSSQDSNTFNVASEYYGTNPLSPNIIDITTNGSYNIMGGQYGYLYHSTGQFRFWRKYSTVLNSSIAAMNYLNSKYFSVGSSGQISYSSDGTIC